MQTLPVPEMSHLSPKQQAALRLLVQGETVSATAAQLHLDRKTVHNWLRPGTRFTFCLDALTDELNQHWLAQLKAATQNALTVINELLADQSAPKHLRLKAALAVLNSQADKGKWPKAPHQLSQSARDLSPQTEFSETEDPTIPQNSPLSAISEPAGPIDETKPLSAPPQNSPLSEVSEPTEPARGQGREGPARFAPIPRRAPCPCGSGQKFKRCCGKNAPPLLDAA